MRPARFTLAPLALAAALTFTLAAGHTPTALAQGNSAQGAAITVNIPAQPLAQALNEMARQADLQMTFPAALVAGRTAPAVSGQFTVDEAVHRLLEGSGLLAEVKGKAVLVRQAAPTTSEADSTLPAVKVTAKALGTESSLGDLNRVARAGALGSKSILDTPFSMTVVSSEQITERGAKSIGQIFANDASVYTSTASSTTDWWGTQIRGMGVRNSYIDDIPMMLYWGGDFPTEIVESVTALKGLTGFMYGFGEPGGALSYELKRPKKTNDTTITLGYRNPGVLSAHVDASRLLDDELAVRVNLAKEEGRAYNESKIDRTVAGLAVDKHFGASVNWFSTLAYENNRLKEEPMSFYFSDYVVGSGGKLPSVSYRYDNFNVDSSYYNSETWLASTGVQWQINDDWNLKYQLGWSRKTHYANKSFAYLQNQAGDYTGYAYNFANQLNTLFTQAMLRGKLTLGGMKHEIVTGLGLQRSKDKDANEWYWSNDFDGNIHRQQTFVMDRTADLSLSPAGADVRQLYAFASDTVHFSEHWQAIIGLRFTRYRLKATNGVADSDYSTSETSPTLALIYKPDAQSSLYGSYIEALEPGNRVAAPYANRGEVLGATVSKQYELGIKRAAGKLDVTAAWFRVERANTMDEFRGTERYLTQDGLLTYQGLDLSGAYQATRNLNVGLSAIYLDATIEKVSPSNAEQEGNTPAFAPKWQVVGNVQYRVPAVRGLKLHGNARYFGKSYASDENTLSVPDRTIVNAGFTQEFRMQNQDWTLICNVYNLLNTKYWAGGGWSQGTMGEARNLSLALRTQF